VSDAFDPTTDPGLQSWVPSAAGSDFPIQHLPYGAFVRAGEATPRLGVAIGDKVLDLHAVAHAGLLDEALPEAAWVFAQPTLNALLQRPKTTWRAVRGVLSRLLSLGDLSLRDEGIAQRALVAQSDVRMTLPIEVRDYVDFYSSLNHALNVGRFFRPDDPLLPNYRWIPIGYHGRSSGVVVSGTPIVRPNGQRKSPDAPAPSFGPCRLLDIELELAFITGDGPPLGTPFPVWQAEDYIFGVALMNDWSARDIQSWEYQPLGPFLGKSFGTSLAAWITPLEALEPFRSTGPVQEPAPLDYLAPRGNHHFDIALEVGLASEVMQREGVAPTVVAETNFRTMYWTMAQQLAHLSSNGSRVQAGDVNGSGTISGSEPGSYGSLLELTQRGTQKLELADGSLRGFLEDGDLVTLRGRCERDGAVPIGLGEASGVVLPAPAPWVD
jgi:fumarylacetoacetase